jgi:hypothetical protein
MLLLVEFRRGIDVGKGIALGAQFIGDRLGTLVEFFAREDVAGPDRHRFPELLLGQREIAGQLDRRNDVTFPLVDADRDVDFLLVRRYRDLRRLDAEFQVAAIEVVGTQGFEVG